MIKSELEMAKLLRVVLHYASMDDEKEYPLKNNLKRKRTNNINKENNFSSRLLLNKIIKEKDHYNLVIFFDKIRHNNEYKYWYSKKGILKYKSLIETYIKAYSS